MNSTRRTFLQASTVSALAATRAWGANDRINVAVIGVGGRGRNHIEEYAKQADARIYGLCDVDQANLERGIALAKKLTGEAPKSFVDMKEVFADPQVHAVSMPLPNHWHALATIWACQAGKDVYVEKPISHNPYEGRKCVEAAAKYGRVVQHGTQSRSGPHVIRAMELAVDDVERSARSATMHFLRVPELGAVTVAPRSSARDAR